MSPTVEIAPDSGHCREQQPGARIRPQAVVALGGSGQRRFELHPTAMGAPAGPDGNAQALAAFGAHEAKVKVLLPPMALYDTGSNLSRYFLTTILAASVASILFEPTLRAFYLLELNYNEGWNVLHSARAISGTALYGNDLYHPVNYPFFSFYIIGWLSEFTGSLLFTGRAIAYASMLAVAFCCFFAVREQGDRQSGAIAALLWLGLIGIVAPGYVGVDDPQMLGHALMLTGLVVYLTYGPRWQALFIVALLVCLGLFVKHNLISLPLAIGIDLLCRSWRALAIWCLATGTWIGVLLVLTYAVARGDFLGELLSPRPYIPEQAMWSTLWVLEKIQIPLLLSPLWIFVVRSNQHILIGSYLVLAIVSGIIFAGGDGVSWNAFFDLLIAVALACGFLLTEVRQLSTLQWRSRLWTLSVLAIAFPFVVQAVGIAGQISGLYEESRHLAAASRVFREDANYLRQKQGPVICESLLLCEYAGKWPAIDPFNERRLAAMKRLDESSLLNEVRDKEIGVIQYTLIPDSNQHSWTSTRFSRAFLDAVQQNYKIDRRSSISQFFVPRE